MGGNRGYFLSKERSIPSVDAGQHATMDRSPRGSMGRRLAEIQRPTADVSTSALLGVIAATAYPGSAGVHGRRLREHRLPALSD